MLKLQAFSEYNFLYCQNPRREGTYKDHPWNFAIKNVSLLLVKKKQHVNSQNAADCTWYFADSSYSYPVVHITLHSFSLQESRSGRLKVIATGSIDLADYISETKKTFDITVSLKAANKNIKSGSMEFSLTSVLLVDGIP